MAIEIGALRALLSLDSAAFERGAKRAEASMSGLQRSLARASQKLGEIGRKMTTRVTLPIVGIGAAAVKSSLSTIDAQSKMAQSLGTSTASMQVLARAADRAGVSTGELEQIARQLTKRLSEAAQGGGPAAKALKRLGISAQSLEGLNMDQKIARINKAIEETVPAAERAAVATAIFGSRAGLVAGRLDASTIEAARKEMERFGVTVSEIEADRVEEANDAISSLGLVVRGLGNQLAVALAPLLKGAAEVIANVAAGFNSLGPGMKTAIAGVLAFAAAIGPVAIALRVVTLGLSSTVGLAASMGGAVLTLAGHIGALIRAFGLLRLALISTGIGALVVAAGVLASWFIKLVQRTGGLGNALSLLGDIAGAVWQGMIDSAKAIPPGLKAVWARMQAGFLFALSNMATKFHDFVWRIGNAANEQGLEGLGKSLMGVAAAASEASGTLYRAGAAVSERAKASIGDAAATIKAAFEPAAQHVAKLGSLMSDAADETDQAAAAARDLDTALDGVGGEGGAASTAAKGLSKVKDEAEKAAEKMKEAFDKVADRIGDAMASAIVDGKNMGDALRGVFKQIAKDLIASGIRKLIVGLFGGLFGGGGGGGGGGLFGGFRAEGGPVAAGRAYIVGERGPELMVPGASGTIVPNHALGGGGGSISISVTVDGARGNAEIEEMVQRGVQGGLAQYDRFLPDRVAAIRRDPRVRY
ncbi:phage tail tape measure protein [Mameliella alba]|uniref:Potassium-transporting ATPase subunit G n=1 Tax=Mameliella alba TaxID=561184 RepID=A0A0B3S3I9_9RHOB|nr:hypothetical protein [Mameliella alba]KHQ51256.1 Potassium-transporting ATPase subunit G [Mameliella alba]